MAELPTDFNPESPEEREIAGEAARDRSDFLSLMGHAYRGEVGRTTSWRTRIDRTTNWAVVLTATLLTWAFSAESRPHYVLLVGIAMVTVFLGIEARRYRVYDIWRPASGCSRRTCSRTRSPRRASSNRTGASS